MAALTVFLLTCVCGVYVLQSSKMTTATKMMNAGKTIAAKHKRVKKSSQPSKSARTTTVKSGKEMCESRVVSLCVYG